MQLWIQGIPLDKSTNLDQMQPIRRPSVKGVVKSGMPSPFISASLKYASSRFYPYKKDHNQHHIYFDI
jgi:hypothetical protein